MPCSLQLASQSALVSLIHLGNVFRATERFEAYQLCVPVLMKHQPCDAGPTSHIKAMLDKAPWATREVAGQDTGACWQRRGAGVKLAAP